MDLGLTNPNRAHILGATNSLYFAGGFIGSFVNSWVSNRYGRKASIASACLLMIVAGALVAGSVHIGMFIAFRFFTGWRYGASRIQQCLNFS
jgi:MFS family permease